jgi:hypothetical protein
MLMKSALTASVSSRAARKVRMAASSRSTTASVFRSSAPKDSAASSIIMRTPGESSPTRIGSTTFEVKTGKIFERRCPPRIDQPTAPSSIPGTRRPISFHTTSRAPGWPMSVERSRWRLTLRGDRTMRAPSRNRNTSWRKSKSAAERRDGSWENRKRSRTRLAIVASKRRSSRMLPSRDLAAVSVIPCPAPAPGAGPRPFFRASSRTSVTVSTMAPMLSSLTR